MPLGGPPALLRCLGSIWRTLVPCRGDITCMTGQEGQLSHGQGVSGRIPGPPLQPMMGGATLTHHTSLRLPARSHAHSYYPPSSLSGSSLLCKHTHSLSISLSLSLSHARSLSVSLSLLPSHFPFASYSGFLCNFLYEHICFCCCPTRRRCGSTNALPAPAVASASTAAAAAVAHGACCDSAGGVGGGYDSDSGEDVVGARGALSEPTHDESSAQRVRKLASAALRQQRARRVYVKVRFDDASDKALIDALAAYATTLQESHLESFEVLQPDGMRLLCHLLTEGKHYGDEVVPGMSVKRGFYEKSLRVSGMRLGNTALSMCEISGCNIVRPGLLRTFPGSLLCLLCLLCLLYLL